jgi:uncharacterized membrane protein YkoI
MIKTTLALLVLLWTPAALAGERIDHDRARRAVEAQEILPLRDIMAKAEAEYPGRLVEAELEDEHGTLVYELKMLAADGKVRKLHYDARTGRLLCVKERGCRP